ncbi:MAG: S9 family peptidase [Bacteroidota bacterium]
MRPFHPILLLLAILHVLPLSGQHLEYMDIFQLEFVSNPNISPDGSQIVYSRNYLDVMTDKIQSDLWITPFDGSKHRPLLMSASSAVWSKDGDILYYMSKAEGSKTSQIFKRWMEDGQSAQLSRLTQGAGSLSPSPDGKWLAFTMFVPKKSKAYLQMPKKPEGAKWAPEAKVIDRLLYRSNGSGYLKDGYRQIFVLSTDGGTALQLTEGEYNHGGPLSWTPDGQAIIFSSNRHDNRDLDPQNSELYELTIQNRSVKMLTSRQGPDRSPVVSPDGKQIAYLGYDDKLQGYQIAHLYVMNRDGSKSKLISKDFDRNMQSIRWAADGKGIYFQYDDKGNSKAGYMDLKGKMSTLAHDLGGGPLGRPYSGGSFTVAKNGNFACSQSTPEHPADLFVGNTSDSECTRLTNLNEDLFSIKKIGKVEELWYTSSFDQRDVQGWIMFPPDFDPTKKYPLILEIHGGPFANYGDRFSAELQLYAAAGYVVLYTNPRGSSSYGAEFGNLIHHNYPGEDYDDLISGVDAVIAKGYIDPDRLYVTGGSGGGVLSSWIVGKTDRFSAAVVAKPVINWYSFVLTSDGYNFYYKYWFPGFPWDHEEHYMKRSPLSLVGNVTTPTMLLTGEADYRTPMSETEQYYQALKLRKVETAMVRIPEAHHGIASRPSHLISKVAHVLEWFGRYE